MSAELEFELPMAPVEFIDRLKHETVSFDEIMSVTAPIDGYTTFLKESLSGSKTIISKTDGHEFRLQCLGIAPFKGRSAVAAVGAMYGSVESWRSGSRVQARFKMAPASVVWLALCVVLLVSAMVGTAVLLTFAVGLEGRLMMLAACAVLMVIASTMIAYIVAGKKTQATLLREFMERFAKNHRASDVFRSLPHRSTQ